MTTIKPFKTFREMDDAQKQKISSHPNLHRPKSEETKQKISDTMKARWAVTPHNPAKNSIYDIMLQEKQPIHLTEQDIRQIVSECIRKALLMINDYSSPESNPNDQ